MKVKEVGRKIDLVRLPFWKRDTITLEDILGNDFLIQKGVSNETMD